MSKKILTYIVLACLGALTGVALSRYQKSPVVQEAPKPVASVTPSPTPASTAASPVASASPSVTPIGKMEGKIVMYHYIRAGVDPKKDPIGYGLSIPPTEFDHQMSLLKKQGYTSVHMTDLLAGRGGAKTIVLTFDDGYEDFYTSAYPILKKYGFTATLYIITGKIGGDYMTWDQLRELQKAGFEIGAHTVTHPDLSKLSEVQQHKELADSKAALEQQLGISITHLCYPSGKYNATTISIAKSLGYTDATTTHPGSVGATDDPFALNRYRMSPGMLDQTLLNLFN